MRAFSLCYNTLMYEYEYKTICATSAKQLDKDVNALLSEATDANFLWELWGSPYYAPHWSDMGMPNYCQALRRRKPHNNG